MRGAMDPSWNATRLEDVSEIRSGFGFPKALQGRSDGDIPVYKVGDISRAWLEGRDVLDASSHFLTEDEVRLLGGRPLPAGATVFAKIGEAVKLNRRALLGRSSAVDNNVMAIIPKAGIEPRFLFHVSKTWDLGRLSQATTVPSVRKADIGSLSVPVPSLDEQRHAVAMIEQGAAVASAVEGEIARALRQSRVLWGAVLKETFQPGSRSEKVELA